MQDFYELHAFTIDFQEIQQGLRDQTRACQKAGNDYVERIQN